MRFQYKNIFGFFSIDVSRNTH
jgi:hypothetical protein